MRIEYPEDCLQAIISTDWWVAHDGKDVCRGALIFAFIPHVDQTPYTFKPIGRKDPDQHDRAVVQAAPLRIDQRLEQTKLPVSAMPLHPGELWAAYRAKARPCLVIATGGPKVEQDLTRGMAKNKTAPMILVVPYYGASKDSGRRAGYNPQLLERVRHCEYPQFLWDKLPVSGAEESIARFDQLRPIGNHHNSFRVSQFKLSADALEVVDEILIWLLLGKVGADSLVQTYRELIHETFQTDS